VEIPKISNEKLLDVAFESERCRFVVYFTPNDRPIGLGPISVTLDVKPNAEAVVVNQLIVPHRRSPEEEDDEKRVVRKLEEGLRIARDFDYWAIFVEGWACKPGFRKKREDGDVIMKD
jgi:hypothetical protein